MIDSTAAGDAFVGGLLFQLARDELSPLYGDLRGKGEGQDGTLSPEALQNQTRQALEFACACGAHAVQHKGAFSSLARYADITLPD